MDPQASDVLVAGRKAAVYPGGELIVAGRCQRHRRTTAIVVEGKFQGQKLVQEFPVGGQRSGQRAGGAGLGRSRGRLAAGPERSASSTRW